jgi:GTPase SAR1 family protein
LEFHSAKIIEFVENFKKGPESLVRDFHRYLNLINMEEIKFVEAFVKDNRTFEEYEELIEKYYKLSRKIITKFEQTTFLHRFEVNKTDLIKYITDSANYCKNVLVNKLISDYQLKAKAYVYINNEYIFFNYVRV